jgi:hypothetical protein
MRQQQLKNAYDLISNQIEFLETTLKESKAEGVVVTEYKQKLKELKKLKKQIKKIYEL